MVGTSGNCGERVALVMASARSLPAFTSCSADGMLSNIIGTWPATVSFSPGALPRYGTWVRRMPAVLANSSPARCSEVPVPGVA